MPPSLDESLNINTSTSPARRVLSRISSPFGSRVRHIVDFEVKPDDPHKLYGPGDIVTGSVRLRATKPTRVTHLVVRLHGYVQVYKNPVTPGDPPRTHPAQTTTSRGHKSGEYFGNGFASLFEDEVVLCGDGRLADGAYQFNFELEFPHRELPSSIDFERGTICYLITATLTRPTTMSPVMTCDHKINFSERIDAASILAPRARTITLEPLARKLRPKARKLASTTDKSRATESSRSDAPGNSSASTARVSSGADGDAALSPNISEVSFQSTESSAGQTSRRGSQSQVAFSVNDAATARASMSKSSLSGNEITAQIETQVGGCRAGDIIPVKISINHTKQIKSLRGIIVTLYRVARVDMRPSIPLGPTEKGKDLGLEEYYPRSRTGLGGLSLSGSGSTHVFRKDLAQTIAPLYIDPQTLTAEINTKIRVPEEAFPTISTVPGQMISFKYYVEVILDLQGRLANQDRNIFTPQSIVYSANMEGDIERPPSLPFGSSIIDTTSIRRDKGVVASTFELVVGTWDSDRQNGKRKMIDALAAAQDPSPQQQPPQQPPSEQAPDHQTQPDDQQQWHYDENVYGYDWYNSGAYHDPQWYQYHYHDYQDPTPEHHPQAYDTPPPQPPVPIPRLEDESQMSEKERVRQAEMRLLPSEPPIDAPEDHSGEGMAAFAPSAPYFPYEPDAGPASAMCGTSMSATATVPEDLGRSVDHPRAPDYEPPPAGSSAQASTAANVTDDKQEIQRRRLQAEASAPPEDDRPAEPSNSGEDHNAPSAPTLEMTDGIADSLEDQVTDTSHLEDSHADAVASPSLPQYER